VPKRTSISVELSAIQVQKPADLIMRQIRDLISGGALSPGDRLPSERELTEKFGVGRGHVREALRRLEFYGVLETFPQSGTVVASMGAHALEGLISNLLDMDRHDVDALNETREFLELHVARLAAERASKPAVAEIRAALERFRIEVEAGRPGVEEDLLFHLAIAKAAKNPIMLSLISLITPDIIRLNKAPGVCASGRPDSALREHERILQAIEARDADEAAAGMVEHMQMTQAQYARSARKSFPASARIPAPASLTGKNAPATRPRSPR
jgi:GntR family transcriptional repressor for pyruvate dehydrogenase complex